MDHMTFENDHTDKLESMILQKFLKGAEFLVLQFLSTAVFNIVAFEYCSF